MSILDDLTRSRRLPAAVFFNPQTLGSGVWLGVWDGCGRMSWLLRREAYSLCAVLPLRGPPFFDQRAPRG